MAAEVSRSELLKRIASAAVAGIILSKLQRSPPPPLLPVAAADAPRITQNLQALELGKFAFVLATTATLGLVFSQKFPAAEAHHFVILGFMAACAAVWNGILFEKISLQLLGITLILVCLYGLVGSFLPRSFSWACWLFGAFSLFPFLSLLVRSLPSQSPSHHSTFSVPSPPK